MKSLIQKINKIIFNFLNSFNKMIVLSFYIKPKTINNFNKIYYTKKLITIKI